MTSALDEYINIILTSLIIFIMNQGARLSESTLCYCLLMEEEQAGGHERGREG